MTVEDIEKMMLKHARKVVKEAARLREREMSYRVLIKEYKPMWERELYSLLRGVLENVALLGRDSGFIGEREAEWVCMCDLFDGSLNFMSGLRYYAYSAALAKNGEIVYALVVDLDDMTYYRAEKGKGAHYVVGKRVEELKKAALKVPASFQIIATNVALKNVHSVEFRCTALELCALAKGAAEIGIGSTWTPELAAGFLIARESGLNFVDWEFRPIESVPIEYEKVRYVCGTPKALKEFHSRVGSISDIVVEVY